MAIGRQPPTERLTFLDDPNRACGGTSHKQRIQIRRQRARGSP